MNDTMQWLKRLFGTTAASDSPSGSPRRITVDHPLIITSPRMGFLNLLGPSAQAIVQEDKVALGTLFASVEQSGDVPPICDVLMIYCEVQSDGRISNYSGGLRDIIRASNAPIVIVASENDANSYTAAARSMGYGNANLVMTLERKGAAFANFFSELFTRMYRGQSMLLAWVDLAPQNPGGAHDNCPGAIFAAEVGHIIFS